MSVFYFKNNALSIDNQFVEDKDVHSMTITNMTLDDSITFAVSGGNSKLLDIDSSYYRQPGVYKAEINNEVFYFKIDGTYNINIKEKVVSDRVLVYIKPDIELAEGRFYFRIEGKSFYFTFPKIGKKEEKYFAFKYPGDNVQIKYCFKSTPVDNGMTSSGLDPDDAENEYGIINISRK